MDTDSFKIYRSFITILKIFEVRGYPLGNGNKNMDFSAFQKKFGSEPEEIRANLYIVSPKRMGALWFDCLGSNSLSVIQKKMTEEKLKKFLVIIKSKITSHAAAAIRNFRTSGSVIETLFEDTIQVDITKHIDIPKHEICTTEEKKAILEAYSVEKRQVPKIFSTEPGIFMLGAKAGDLIRIYRQSDYMPYIIIDGEKRELFDITYRIVVRRG